jgi:Ser/Thr protein kinase RdoA (MazF antagonist)
VEEPLAGGNATENVVRVGATVRKPWSAATPGVFAYMDALRASGVDVPAPLGRDERGRQVIEFVPGQIALDSPPLTLDELARVGELVRSIHDASRDFVPQPPFAWNSLIPAPGSDLICHNDLAPWNLVIGERWVFIDWDGAAPSTRLWDLAYAAQAFTLSNARQDPDDAAAGLVAFVDGYGADRDIREQLPSAMARRASAMHDLLQASHLSGREPWGTMYGNGHGAHWHAAARYVGRHHDLWLDALRHRA